MSGVATNRTNITLPVDVAQEIMQKTQEGSAIMQLANQIVLPGRGAAINVITSDPEASWVSETAAKPVSNPGVTTKVMRAYKLAVIVPFSNEFKRDVASLYDALVARLPKALALKFDATVFGKGDKPGDDFDNFANVTKQSLASDAYGGLVAADTDIAIHGGVTNGYAISPQMKGVLLSALDKNDRPLFINSVAEGAIPQILGNPTYLTKAAFISGSPSVVGIVGDWTQAMYGTVEGVQISISDQATLDIDAEHKINLFQQNMFAVRAEIEVGFRADTSVFNALTATGVPSV
jgi:HK97 family phage major capsid protein